jgi:uncharacterized protein (DUF302 family)
MTEYGYSVEVPDGYDEAVIRARLAMKAEGFSIITEMHIGGLLGAEAGADRQYLIMGAWAPAAGQRVVGGDLEVAVHLPCNVVVQETDTTAVVAALDPADEIAAGDEAALATAELAREALGRLLQRVSTPL